MDNEEFAEWVIDERTGHGTPDGRSWDDWYTAYADNPDSLTGDLNEGLKLFMGRGKCATCHVVKGNPRALGVAGPNLTNVGSRMSIAAGWLNHRMTKKMGVLILKNNTTTFTSGSMKQTSSSR